jgi:NADPH:quinone reductase-like Zn-dependent oxidoreductase
MQAIVQHHYGTADVLRLDEIERPTIRPNEVVVQVKAAGMDRGTWHVMQGKPCMARLALGLRSPRVAIPGLDLAGVVVATGPDTTRFQVGDEVFGIGKGSFAQFAAAKEDKLALKPSNLTFEQAAAVPVSGLTALQGLTDTGGLKAGHRVLITGASGGVGSYAVQIAKALGAEVTGVCSTAKMEFVRSLGADHVLDYSRDDFLIGSTTYDLILDIGGSSPVSRLRCALAERGTLVIVGGEGGDNVLGIGRQLRAVMLSPFVRQRLAMLVSSENYTDLERLAAMLERGEIVPAIDRTYPLSDVPAAMRRLEAGQVRGKLVISI